MTSNILCCLDELIFKIHTFGKQRDHIKVNNVLVAVPNFKLYSSITMRPWITWFGPNVSISCQD